MNIFLAFVGGCFVGSMLKKRRIRKSNQRIIKHFDTVAKGNNWKPFKTEDGIVLYRLQ